MELDELIEFEGENTKLDFKATQYKKDNYFELLKDIIAMANAPVEGDRLIITGVKKHADNTATIHPIHKDEFTDSAIYNKLVADNIEPELSVGYTPHLYKGSQLVGVLRISKCVDKPYMMKKAFGSDKASRKAGESFIRKGTSTAPLMRSDLNRIIEKKLQTNSFDHPITCYFSGTQKAKELNVKAKPIEFTSQKKAKQIQAILEKREKREQEHQKRMKTDKFYAATAPAILKGLEAPYYYSPLSPSPSYEQRSIETLQKNLENIKETYREHDYYELFEVCSEKVNITVYNEGDKYLEDAVIEVRIPRINGLVVADKVYSEPVDKSSYNILGPMHFAGISENAYYSKYTLEDKFYMLSEGIGNLRHLQPVEVFRIPIRITVSPDLTGSTIEIKLRILGKNLPSPITNTLSLVIN